MRRKIVSILLGIMDALLPSLTHSLEKKEDGKNDINLARFMAALLSWTITIASIAGWIEWHQALELLKMLFLL